MPKQESPRTRWQFTWHNFPDDYDNFFLRMQQENIIKGVICQIEICPSTGREHLQGYVVFKKQYRLAPAKAKFPDDGIHLTAVGGTKADHDKSYNYCKKLDTCKEGTHPLELGKIAPAQGDRTDLKEFKADVVAGMSWDDLQDKHDSATSKCKQWCYGYFGRHRPKPPPNPDFQPRDWHRHVHDAIANPCYRHIHFIVDEVGGAGKSWLCDHLKATRNDLQLFKPAKLDAMQYLLSESRKVFLIDCPRSRQDIHIPYDFLEGIKDGEMLSTKYEPMSKYITRPNTVVVFMNEVPDTEKISVDRFIVWFRRKAGWVRATPGEDSTHWGQWLIPPVEGDTEGKTIYRTNHAQAKQLRKRKRETQQDEYREIQLQLARQKVEDLDRRNNACGIPHDNRFGLEGGVESIQQLE